MKKIRNILGVVVLTLFSFYYTNKMVELSKSKDEIMKEIISNKEKFTVEAVNAYIENDYIIPGMKGIEVDIDKSYYKMKELGSYNENLYFFINEDPEISIKNNYNKFIINGNKEKNNIYLIFTLKDKENIDKILSVLNNNNVKANFFIDGKTFENEIETLQKIIDNNNFLGNLGYENNYKITTIKNTNALIERIVKYNNNFCYVEDDNYDTLDICSKIKMYTIKSKKVSNINPYLYIKENITKGGIYTLDTNSYTIEELPVIIKYIKQKGYNITTLDNIIDESIS